MHIRRALAGATVFALALLWSVSSTSAITLEEFDGFDGYKDDDGNDIQGLIIADTLNAYYDYYQGNAETKYIADCMTELYQQDTGAGSELINLILDQLDLTRAEYGQNGTVEYVVETAIKNACVSP